MDCSPNLRAIRSSNVRDQDPLQAATGETILQGSLKDLFPPHCSMDWSPDSTALHVRLKKKKSAPHKQVLLQHSSTFPLIAKTGLETN